MEVSMYGNVKLKKIVTTLIVVILFAGCNTNKITTSWNEERQIQEYEVIYSDDKFEAGGDISEMRLWNNVLILYYSSGEYLFDFIDIATGERLCYWGRRGRGEGEYLSTGSSFEVNDTTLMFIDDYAKLIIKADVRAILNGASDAIVSRQPYPYTRDFRPRTITSIGEVMVATGVFSSGCIGLMDSEAKVIPNHTPYAIGRNLENAQFAGMLFQRELMGNQYNRKIVQRYYASDIFEIYTVQDTILNKIYLSEGGNEPQLKFTQHPERPYIIDYDNSIAGFVNMDATDNGIYFTYLAESYAKVTGSELCSNELLSFDWNGCKKVKYLLPVSVAEFCTDDNYLYGVGFQEAATLIYRIPLN